MDASLATNIVEASIEITTAALSGDDPEAVLPLVARRAAALADADLCLIGVRGADDRLTIEAAHSEADRLGLGPVGIVLSARSVAARVARGGVPAMVDDVTANPGTAPFVPAVLRGYGPFAVVPFGTRERRLGALSVYRHKGSRPFAPITVDVLTSFAAQAGLAIVLAEGSHARQEVAVYQERERIARDLHDVIVQRLYAAGMQLNLLDRELGAQLRPAGVRRLAEAIDQLDQTIAEVRATVRALRNVESVPDAQTDLLESLRAEVDAAGELLGFTPEFQVEGIIAETPPLIADHVRAALRETLTNVVRHSGASTVRVRIRLDADELDLTVTDDGCGIPEGVTRRGLLHLAERAEELGGTCTVCSSAREGTTVLWQVPVSAGQ